MELHTLVISIIVISILIVQFNVFRGTISKIKSYINIFKDTNKFKIHKVYIPIEEIDSINSEDILSNLEYYTQNPILNQKIFIKPEIVKLEEDITSFKTIMSEKDVINKTSNRRNFVDEIENDLFNQDEI
jgi:hypothetical protein